MKRLIVLFILSGLCLATTPHDWIGEISIRAGQCTDGLNPSYVSYWTDPKLNTVIYHTIDHWEDAGEIDALKDRITAWALKADQQGLKFFVGFNFQDSPGVEDVVYDKVVIDDGTASLVNDPFDLNIWTDRIIPICEEIATLSLTYPIVGLEFDMEAYGTEAQPTAERNCLIDNMGYGDNAWAAYKTDRSYTPDPEPASADLRKAKLVADGFLTDYFDYLQEFVTDEATAVKAAIDAINSDLLVGMYPTPKSNNWLLYPMAKVLGTEAMPLIVFGTESYGYVLDGDDNAWTNIGTTSADLTVAGIKHYYACGGLLYKFTGPKLNEQLKQELRQWDGCWLYHMNMIYNWAAEPAKLDTAASLNQAIKRANSPPANWIIW